LSAPVAPQIALIATDILPVAPNILAALTRVLGVLPHIAPILPNVIPVMADVPMIAARISAVVPGALKDSAAPARLWAGLGRGAPQHGKDRQGQEPTESSHGIPPFRHSGRSPARGSSRAGEICTQGHRFGQPEEYSA
jgi:hypothetical protein